MGTNLDFNERIGDTCFAILICIFGLILFALLIGNLQVYLQSRMPYTLAKEREKFNKKRKALQKWGPFSSLPFRLRVEVLKWVDVSEVNLESFLKDLPWDLRGRLRRHFCENLFNKMKEFEKLDSKDKKFLRRVAKPVVYQAGDIIQEDEPTNKMIHIIEGTVSICNDNGERKEHKELKGGDSFGEELLLKKGKGRSATTAKSEDSEPPLAKQTVKARTKVEAFALSAREITSRLSY